MRTRKHPYKFQRQRQERAQRLERVKNIKAEIARVQWKIGRLHPQDDHKQVRQLTAQLRTLEQRVRYINVE